MNSEKIKSHCFDIHRTDIEDSAALELAIQVRKRYNSSLQSSSSKSSKKRKAQEAPRQKIQVEKVGKKSQIQKSSHFTHQRTSRWKMKMTPIVAVPIPLEKHQLLLISTS
jgi:hypothetical protein